MKRFSLFLSTALAISRYEQKEIPSFNGLSLTPPMGFMTWQRFRCETNCDTSAGHHNRCISEWLIREVADAMVENGWLDLGYNYLIIDDCWPEKTRNATGYLVPDSDRFPSGMDNLAKYVRSKGLKFGIYGDYGTLTCGGYPGTYGFEQQDVDLFTEWGVEYYKLDGCYSNQEEQQLGYPMVSAMLLEKQQLGYPGMVYSCSYPAYWEGSNHNLNVDYQWLAKHCNLWRNYGDINDSFEDVKDIMSWFARNQIYLAPYAGPGHWNDPDMLVGGNGVCFSKN